MSNKIKFSVGDIVNWDIPLSKSIFKPVDNSNLLNELYNCDLEILVGGYDQDNVKIFKAHSNILKERSSYFKVALSNNWIKKSDDGIIIFQKENISPKVFQLLLIYMYTGIIGLDNLDPNEFLELLEACDELCFDEIIEDLQNHLIEKEKIWIKRNLVYFHNFVSENLSFNLLQEYCDEFYYNHSELFLKSDDMEAIEKSMFMYIINKDNLPLYEIKIWDYVIHWGVGQNKDLGRDISEWNRDDFISLKKVLEDIIPLIRFKEITSKDFYKKITPFENLFNKELYKELHQYYNSEELYPKLLLQEDSRNGKGKLLNFEMKFLISDWIDSKTYTHKKDELPYRFELILKGTQDGFARSVFQQRCYDIEQTLLIMKLKETGELLGGYNPTYWNIKGKPIDKEYIIRSDKSFIYKIVENQLNDSILSRVTGSGYALSHNKTTLDFIKDDIRFHEILANFCDLQLYNSFNNEPYCFYSFPYNSYKNNLNLKNNSNKVHLLEEYEVYKLVKKLE